MTRKPGSASAQRDVATVRVNAHLVKLEERAARLWADNDERLTVVDAALLHAWSERESAAHFAETAEAVVGTLEPLIRQTNNEALSLVERLDTLTEVTRTGTERLARWTAVLSLAAGGLLLLGIFQLWVMWRVLTH